MVATLPLASPISPAVPTPAKLAEPIRVMIVDDSLTVRTVFSRLIESVIDMDVGVSVGTAERALDALRSHPVDVVLLDLEMPGMGGLAALPLILERSPGIQVLVISSLTATGAEQTLEALRLGAADTMLKPRPGGFSDAYKAQILARIRALGGKAAPMLPFRAALPRAVAKRPQIVAIGASTGGIHALNLLLRALPRGFDLPILVTQHLPDSFIPVFARQVETVSGRRAVLADEGTEIRKNQVVIAPGHSHLIVRHSFGRPVTGLAYHPVRSGCTPSVDPMFESLATAYEGAVAGVLLSGMGRDGSDGADAIIAAGGAVYAQSAESCAVWGMPRSITESGKATGIGAPQELARQLAHAAGLAG